MHSKETFRGIIWCLLVFTAIFGVGQAIHFISNASNKASDHTNHTEVDFVDPQAIVQKKQAEIRALDAQIVASKEAIARLTSCIQTRTVSRSDDREEFNKLNEHILDLERQRSQIEAEINTHPEK